MTSLARLVQVAPRGATLRFDLDPEQVTPGGGVGGWEEVAHPKRPATTRWTGGKLRTRAVSLLLDGWRDQRSVEEQCRVLEAFARPQANTISPPVLQFAWGADSAFRWVIEDLQWGDELRDPQGRRVRAQVTVSLMEYRDERVIVTDPRRRSTPAPTGTPRPSATRPTASGRVYVVRQGDTGQKIAQRELGNARRWGEVVKLNGLRDPDFLRVGQRLRLPA